MNASGPVETFFVVASTDMERSAIMIARMRELLERIPGLSAPGVLTITATPLHLQEDDLGGASSSVSLEQQVQIVASRVTDMVVQNLHHKPDALPTSTTPTTAGAASGDRSQSTK